MSGKNFVINSQNMIVYMLLIPVEQFVFWILNKVTKMFARFAICRRIGIKVYMEPSEMFRLYPY